MARRASGIGEDKAAGGEVQKSCRFCGELISGKARVCPHCRYNQGFSYWFVGILSRVAVVPVVLALIALTQVAITSRKAAATNVALQEAQRARTAAETAVMRAQESLRLATLLVDAQSGYRQAIDALRAWAVDDQQELSEKASSAYDFILGYHGLRGDPASRPRRWRAGIPEDEWTIAMLGDSLATRTLPQQAEMIEFACQSTQDLHDGREIDDAMRLLVHEWTDGDGIPGYLAARRCLAEFCGLKPLASDQRIADSLRARGFSMAGKIPRYE